MAAKVERKRSVRSVTLDDDLVAKAKAVGKTFTRREENLSRLIDRALTEMVERYAAPKGRRK